MALIVVSVIRYNSSILSIALSECPIITSTDVVKFSTPSFSTSIISPSSITLLFTVSVSFAWFVAPSASSSTAILIFLILSVISAKFSPNLVLSSFNSTLPFWTVPIMPESSSLTISRDLPICPISSALAIIFSSPENPKSPFATFRISESIFLILFDMTRPKYNAASIPTITTTMATTTYINTIPWKESSMPSLFAWSCSFISST